MSWQYGELQRDQLVSLGAPQPTSTGFTSWLHNCTDVARWRSTRLCTMFGRLLHWYTMYTFWGLCPPNGILPGAKFTLHPSLAFSYIGSITARHSSSVHEPNFVVWYKEWNYGTVAPHHFQQRARHLHSKGGHHVGNRPTI